MKLKTTSLLLFSVSFVFILSLILNNSEIAANTSIKSHNSVAKDIDQTTNYFVFDYLNENKIDLTTSDKNDSILMLTLKQLNSDQKLNNRPYRSEKSVKDELAHIDNSRFLHASSQTLKNYRINSADNKFSNEIGLPFIAYTQAEKYIRILQLRQDPLTTYSGDLTKVYNIEALPVIDTVESKELKSNSDNTLIYNFAAKKVQVIKGTSKKAWSPTKHIGYWQTVHSIESKQGKLLYRPRNKSRSCTYTTGPCGHHQLTVKALKDIGCHSMQCRKDRLDYNKSLALSKKLLALNEKRLRKNGISQLEDYERYLIHQQGASGIKNIIAATKGKKELSSTIKKNMANNSPYSYKQFKRMGSKTAAKTFMHHWKNKWMSEKHLILASNSSSPTDNQLNPDFVPTFDEKELMLAFNIKF